MKVLIIGGNGIIGRAVSKYLANKHDVIIAGRTNAEVTIDIADSKSLVSALESIRELDGIICIAGEAKWAPFDELSEEDYYIGFRSKLMGQVNLVRLGRAYLKKGGSITLSTGGLADDPVIKTASAAMVNGAIHSFVKAVDLEIENDVRVNVVSLGLVEDSYEKYKDYFPGHTPISMKKAINAYVKSLEGHGRGEVIRVYT